MELDISTLQTHEKITHYQGYGHITTRTAALSTTILEGDYE